jgi:Xaa-Pro dipeptidase
MTDLSMDRVPEGEIVDRLRKLQAALQEAQIGGAFIAQNADLFYFTGTLQSGALFVPERGEPTYFVRKDLARARRESPIRSIEAFGAMRDLPQALAKLGYSEPKTLAFEWDVMPVALYDRYQKTFRDARHVDLSSILRRLRRVKSPYEVKCMRAAARQADSVFCRAKEVIRAGMTELELAAELERCARLQGHPGLIRMRSFNGEMVFAHVFSGPNSAVPAYLDTPLGGVGLHPSFGQGASYRQIRAHEPVIVDTGSFAYGYLADQTRVLCIGALPEPLAQAYADMLTVQRHMKRLVRPGVSWTAVYESCLQLVNEQGHTERFMGIAGTQARFIGHGLGIEIDEQPLIAPGFDDERFEVGMTFAFEPKAVFDGLGAVGIENTFVVVEGGVDSITYSDEALAIVN